LVRTRRKRTQEPVGGFRWLDRCLLRRRDPACASPPGTGSRVRFRLRAFVSGGWIAAIGPALGRVRAREGVRAGAAGLGAGIERRGDGRAPATKESGSVLADIVAGEAVWRWAWGACYRPTAGRGSDGARDWGG
jgi:hypothetical protein